ncbi:putative NUDIX hydrolase [Rubripirellula tenax]|uniref:Putative NUDIX hydrolase n=1 Tax=Rubripirellula tenax TaxID=2528015 RepID=A0A5C6FIM9_9BACT|nr:CoA pyrophosphatase [Rubripirellula tenax]TWU60443.1 putative NUDIX hydrolase [Rubripirellula tenax]
MNSREMAELIERCLAATSGRRFRSPISPTLSYGRHRGPVPSRSRVAAVAVALYRDQNDGWTIPLTLRPMTLSHHGGQISLPGGQVDPGESIREAAIREFDEELGVLPNVQAFCGQLASQYVYASGNVVHPVVMVIDPPRGVWKPDPIEVEHVISLPLRVLVDPKYRAAIVKTRPIQRVDAASDESVDAGSMRFRAGAIRYDGHEIWGATGMILDQLAHLLLPYVNQFD